MMNLFTDPARVFVPSIRQLPPIGETTTPLGGLKQSAKSQFHRLRYSGTPEPGQVEEGSDAGIQKFSVAQPEINSQR
jgi:hypothetical protein